MQTKAAFFSFKDSHMSSLTAEVAVAVKATMGTLNVQNGDAGKGHTVSKQIHIKLFVYSEMSLLFQTVWPEYQI